MTVLDYQVSFRCSECEHHLDSLPLFEKHIWAYHLNDFAYRCASCGLPALTVEDLKNHYSQQHDPEVPVEYKRKLEQECDLKYLIASSIAVAVKVACDTVAANSQQSGRTEARKQLGEDNQLYPLEHVEDQAIEGDHESYVRDITPDQNTHSFEEFPPEFQQYGQQSMEEINFIEHTDNSSPPQQHQIVDSDIPPSVDSYHEGYGENENESWVNRTASKSEPQSSSSEGFTFVDEYGNTIVDERYDGLQVISGEEITVMGEPSSAYKKPLTYYKCDVCGKLLRYPSKIEEHRRSHTGEKPFPCTQCDKRFTQKGALRCHERLHTGEKPYICRWDCGRGFVSASARLMHENTHAGIRSFACKFCGQLFAKKYHVERHEKRHKNLNSPTKAQATGLDAAGDHLFSLLDAVTDVVDSVQKSNQEKTRQTNGINKKMKHMAPLPTHYKAEGYC